MHQSHPGGRLTPAILRYLALVTALILSSCASPGPPRPPSLHLPQPVQNLTAIRVFNTVELHFTVPDESTDKVPLHGQITGQLCRQVTHNECITLDSSKVSAFVSTPDGKRNDVTWTDQLPLSLTQGPPKLLTYRIKFFSPTGRSAGFSSPAFTASGAAPPAVGDLEAKGTRLGVLLSWNSVDGFSEIVLHRETLSSPRSHPKTADNRLAASTRADLLLSAPDSSHPPMCKILDTNVMPDTTYRYVAQRRLSLLLDSHKIELQGQLSTPISFTLRRIYAPPAPYELTAVGYVSGLPPVFAVDLIWQPTIDTGLITPLAGYNVYRQLINSNGQPISSRIQLNASPIPSPAFHDSSARAAMLYRYSVAAIDTSGNESPPAITVLKPVPTD